MSFTNQNTTIGQTLLRKIALVVGSGMVLALSNIVSASTIIMNNANGGKYAPEPTTIYAYNTGTNAGGGSELSATMQGVTFLPWNFNVSSPPSSPANPAGVPNTSITQSGAGAFQPTPPLTLGGTDSTALRELLRGGFFASSTLTLTLGGLDSAKTYQVDIFVETNNDSRTENFTFTGATVATDFFSTDATHAYDVRENLAPNGSGQIVITLPSATTPFLNAFSVTIPEPASLGFLGTGGLLLLRRRRSLR